MSVERDVIALLVDEGSIKKAHQHGITTDDFQEYQEEFDWLVRRHEKKKTINPRIFKERFDDFEWVLSREKIQDLFVELKQERTFSALNAAIETSITDLDTENAVEKAGELRDYLSEIVRLHSPIQEVHIGRDWERHIERAKQLRAIRADGEIAGIPTGFRNLDHAYGGWMPGRVITYLGRSGEGKTFTLEYHAKAAWMGGYRIGLFSPEMDEHEHVCRLHTLMSADDLIQQQTGIPKSFRNRALMEGVGYNLKKYRHFCQYLSSLRGEVILFNKQHYRGKLPLSFVESRIDDLGLDFVIIDPIYKMRSLRKRDSKVWELTDLIEEVEDVAKSYRIPIIITNQSHRQNQSISTRRRAPHKDTSYMSDALIHESDHVIGTKFDAEDHRLYMRCSKSRFGGEFEIESKFYPNIGLLKELTEPKGDWFNGSGEESRATVPQVQEAIDA